MGDARLTFAREPDGIYDLIIVDAYSSDAIPIHLATQEAMKIYKDKLAPQGAVLMHVSNRHLELASVVVGIAEANDLKSWVYDEDSDRDERIHLRNLGGGLGARGGRCRPAGVIREVGADRARRQPAGLDRRLFQRAGRGLPPAARRRAVILKAQQRSGRHYPADSGRRPELQAPLVRFPLGLVPLPVARALGRVSCQNSNFYP